jgi:hypothetical protein
MRRRAALDEEHWIKRPDQSHGKTAETATGKADDHRQKRRPRARLSMIHNPHAAVNEAAVHFPPPGR